ncbi:rCG25435 [Rattus norvegicus]|uniref:RCG25435 n=1 Tax=Rattus norvegicus TaxID=10116 RepID=A6I2A6_RAT|nr:rCG25435 [Rattus norvegicus]
MVPAFRLLTGTKTGGRGSATKSVDTVLSRYILHIKFLEYFKIQTNQNTKSSSYSICATTTEHHTLDGF